MLAVYVLWYLAALIEAKALVDHEEDSVSQIEVRRLKHIIQFYVEYVHYVIMHYDT